MAKCRGCRVEVHGSGTRYCSDCPTKHDQQGRKPPITEKVCVVCGTDLVVGKRKSDICDLPQCKKELDWRRNLWRNHHIRAETFYQMCEAQKWCCAVCKDPLLFAIDGSKNGINVDHDHSCCPSRIGCGACIRGVVCNGCNGGMGLFKDNPENLIAAAEYLIAYQERRKNA